MYPHTPVLQTCKKCEIEQPRSNFKEIVVIIGENKIISYNLTCFKCEELKILKYRKDYRDCSHRSRIKLIQIMGGKCICCGITEWWNLTIDHIIPVKTQKREDGKTLIRKLIKDSELRKDFQILCFGCNGSKNSYEKCQLDHNR